MHIPVCDTLFCVYYFQGPLTQICFVWFESRKDVIFVDIQQRHSSILFAIRSASFFTTGFQISFIVLGSVRIHGILLDQETLTHTDACSLPSVVKICCIDTYLFMYLYISSFSMIIKIDIKTHKKHIL